MRALEADSAGLVITPPAPSWPGATFSTLPSSAQQVDGGRRWVCAVPLG